MLHDMEKNISDVRIIILMFFNSNFLMLSACINEDKLQ